MVVKGHMCRMIYMWREDIQELKIASYEAMLSQDTSIDGRSTLLGIEPLMLTYMPVTQIYNTGKIVSTTVS